LLRTHQYFPTSGSSTVIRFRRTQLLSSRSNNDDSNNLNFIYRDSCVTPSSNSDDRRWRQNREDKQEQHKKYDLLILFTRSEYFIFAIILYPLFHQISRILEIWTFDQDEKLKELVAEHGMGWTKIGELFGERNGKQCRERWYNHLDPAVNKGEWTLEV
jgi:Myb-like DNA-binding domain